MIEPNFTLLLWLLVLKMALDGVANIYAGAVKMEKPTKYSEGEIVVGIIQLIIIALILLL